MRDVPSDIASKLAMKKQTRANNADPSASIWIGRPTTPLVDDRFLEKQTVVNTPITDVSIAVCHPHLGKVNTKTYLAYITNGKAKVVFAQHKAKMSNHIWIETEFNEDADSVSIAFNGIMPKNIKGDIEFVTEQEPWMFWTKSGKLYCRKLGTSNTIILAEANCTDVSAIRATWSEIGDFDFGLVVFFILAGDLFYRQYINDEWMDAEIVSYGPSSVLWFEIAAFRTWNYRVGVQAKTTTGDVYELFTQFMGIAKQTAEHITLNDIYAQGKLTKISPIDTKLDENISLTNINASGLIQWGLPVFAINVKNIINDNDNWGEYLEVILDHPCYGPSLSSNYSSFKIIDENGASFYPYEVSTIDNGLTLLLRFLDFNAASGECELFYIPGTIVSPPVGPTINMLEWSFTFTPINLVPPMIEPPEFDHMFNF